jgi:hypothetical protein
MRVLLIVLLALGTAGIGCADELEDAYKSLKAAEAAKDADGVIKWAAATSALARKAASAQKPDLKDVEDAEDVLKAWQQRIDYAKQVDTYTEYALYALAVQDPNKAIPLIEALEKSNEKSEYLIKAYPTYLVALARSNQQPKMLEAAERGLTRDPASEDIMLILADGYWRNKQPEKALPHAAKLIELMESKPKPAAVDEATWDKKKKTILVNAYVISGVIQADKRMYADADKNLRAAIPLVSDQPAMAGQAYFYLGVSNYNLAKATKNPKLLKIALDFSEKAASYAGPYKDSAVKNYNSIKAEMSGQPLRK